MKGALGWTLLALAGLATGFALTARAYTAGRDEAMQEARQTARTTYDELVRRVARTGQGVWVRDGDSVNVVFYAVPVECAR